VDVVEGAREAPALFHVVDFELYIRWDASGVKNLVFPFFRKKEGKGMDRVIEPWGLLQ
jgi:hypothetical protein